MTTSTHSGAFAAFLFAAHAAGLAQCPHQGSQPTPARIEPAPFALGCPAAPRWPAWHLATPAHRAPAARLGFAPGKVRALPCWLQTWRCTGWLLPAVVPEQTLAMGYVFDRGETACLATH